MHFVVCKILVCIWWLLFCLSLSSSKKEILGSVLEKGIQSRTINGQGEGWELRQSSAYTCGTGSTADFWFFTKDVDLSSSYADVIYVDVEAAFKLCDDPGKANPVPCASNYYEVYIHRGKTNVDVETATLDDFFAVFSLVHNITSGTIPGGIRFKQTFSFNPNDSKAVTFAVRSRGACGYVTEMKMYYYYCEETFFNSVKLMKTPSPLSGFKLVTANCSKNSLASSNVTRLEGRCYCNGSWDINKNFKCSCIKGYEPNEKRGCSLCQSDSSKQQVSNSKCSKCPLRRISSKNRTSCRCGDGYYKSPRDVNDTFPCYGPLVLDKSPEIEEDTTSVIIKWTKPNQTESLNETIVYDVECFLCKDKNARTCESSSENVAFNPGQKDLVSTSVVVTKLQPGKSYIFRVYPKNSLNDMIPKDDWKFLETKLLTYQPQSDAVVSAVSNTSNRMIYIILAAATAGLLLGIILIAILVKRKRLQKQLSRLSSPVDIPLKTAETSRESQLPIYQEPDYQVPRVVRDGITNKETSAEVNTEYEEPDHETATQYETYEEPNISSQNAGYAELNRNRRRNSENNSNYQKLQRRHSEYVIPDHGRRESYEDIEIARNLPDYMELDQSKRETQESLRSTYQKLGRAEVKPFLA